MRYLIPDYKLPDLKDKRVSETDVRAAIQALGEGIDNFRYMRRVYLQWLADREIKKLNRKEVINNAGRTRTYKVFDDEEDFERSGGRY